MLAIMVFAGRVYKYFVGSVLVVCGMLLYRRPVSKAGQMRQLQKYM